MSDDNVSVNFDDAAVEETVITSPVYNGLTYGSPAWQAYVLDQLRDDEKITVGESSFPKCAGLRRLAELLLGDIVFMGPTQVFPSMSVDGPGRATVVVEVHILWTRAPNNYVDLDATLVPPRVFSEVSDTWIGNCQPPYVNHPVSTASTKALSRALKNALGLNVSTAEEMAGNPKYVNPELPEKSLDEIVKETVKSPISKQQVAFINVMCEQMSIDNNKLTQKMFTKDLQDLDKTEGSDVIKALQNYKATTHTIPDDVKV